MTASKITAVWTGSAMLVSVLHAAEPSAFEILNYEEKISENRIMEVKFEPSGKKRFRLYNAELVPGEGTDRYVLKMERTADSSPTPCATIGLPPAVPDADYTVEVNVRGENMRKGASAGRFHCLDVESRVISTGKMAHWRDGTIRAYGDFPGRDFSPLRLDFKGKEGLQPFVKLNIPAGFLGTLYFDDLKVYRKGLPSVLKLTAPALQIFRTGNGKFEVTVTPVKVSDPVLLAVLHHDNKILRSVIVRPDLDNVFRGDFGDNLKPGDAGLRLIFADAAEKVKLGFLDVPCCIESVPE